MEQAEKINFIREWLKTGSINIFGMPMSGKDTVGVRLAEMLGAKFLSSGLILRKKEEEAKKNYTKNGQLSPTNVFFDVVLPYFYLEELKPFPLILSSVGRWIGEETEVLRTALESGHETKLVILLQISEKDVFDRWEAARILEDRGDRDDDHDRKTFEFRCKEFREKTLPVITYYRELGLLVDVNADQNREEVFREVIEKIYIFAKNHPS